MTKLWGRLSFYRIKYWNMCLHIFVNNPLSRHFPPGHRCSLFWEMQLIRGRIHPFGKINYVLRREWCSVALVFLPWSLEMWRIGGPSFTFKREHIVPRCCQPPRKRGREVCTPKGKASLKSQVSRLKCEGRRSVWGSLWAVSVARLRPGFSLLSFDPSLCIGRTWRYHGQFKGRYGILLRSAFILSLNQWPFPESGGDICSRNETSPPLCDRPQVQQGPAMFFLQVSQGHWCQGITATHVQAQEQLWNLVNDS